MTQSQQITLNGIAIDVETSYKALCDRNPLPRIRISFPVRETKRWLDAIPEGGFRLPDGREVMIDAWVVIPSVGEKYWHITELSSEFQKKVLKSFYTLNVRVGRASRFGFINDGEAKEYTSRVMRRVVEELKEVPHELIREICINSSDWADLVCSNRNFFGWMINEALEKEGFSIRVLEDGKGNGNCCTYNVIQKSV